jgi:hypothetical protein
MKPRSFVAIAAACVFWPSPAHPQVSDPGSPPPALFTGAALLRALGPLSPGAFVTSNADQSAAAAGQGTGAVDDGRRCAGCPVRRLVRPYFESLALDAMYNTGNHLRGHHTARVGLKSWWQNLRHGFEWDNNPWGVNQIGHPYQGSNYFTSARAHGLTFWESTPVAAFGSATWEFLAENNRASLNDLINTTLGGIALGEVMHRVGWLIRDPTATGGSRRWKELLATAIDPMGGLQRFTSGDAKRVSEKPTSLIPASVTTRIRAGALWQGRNARQVEAAAVPFVDMEMDYGSIRTGRDTVPFGAFEVTFQSRGSNALAGLAARGRFLGRPFGPDGRAQFSIFQTYDYIRNRAYAFGGQGVEAEVALTKALSSTTSLWMSAAGGATVLGAVDTIATPPDGAVVDAALLSRRTYDYGPTLRFGGSAELQRTGRALARLAYQGYQLSVVDGVRSFHVLQRVNLDVHVPLTRALSLGLGGEYFFRKAYFWPAGNRIDQSPQFRVFAAWRQP